MENSNSKIMDVVKLYTHNEDVRKIKKELIRKIHGSDLTTKDQLRNNIIDVIIDCGYTMHDLIICESDHTYDEYSYNPRNDITIHVLINGVLWEIFFETSGTINGWSKEPINQYYVSDYVFKFDCKKLKKFEEFFLTYGKESELLMIDFVFDREEFDSSYKAAYKNYEISERNSSTYDDCLSGSFEFKNYKGKINVNNLLATRKNMLELLSCDDLFKFCDENLGYSEEKITWRRYGL